LADLRFFKYASTLQSYTKNIIYGHGLDLAASRKV